MMSADYMDQLKRDAANRSRRENITPTLLLPAHKEGKLKPSIPFIGDRTWKRDWIEVDLKKLLPRVDAYDRGDVRDSNIFFVDSSGFGSEHELAITLRKFLAMAPVGFGYAVVGVGQFQVCVKCFIPPTSMRTTGVNYDVARETEAA